MFYASRGSSTVTMTLGQGITLQSVTLLLCLYYAEQVGQ